MKIISSVKVKDLQTLIGKYVVCNVYNTSKLEIIKIESMPTNESIIWDFANSNRNRLGYGCTVAYIRVNKNDYVDAKCIHIKHHHINKNNADVNELDIDLYPDYWSYDGGWKRKGLYLYMTEEMLKDNIKDIVAEKKRKSTKEVHFTKWLEKFEGLLKKHEIEVLV